MTGQGRRPRRDKARQARMMRRLTSARTAEEQLAAAYDWFRMSASRLPDAAGRAGLLREVSQYLASRAAETDGSG